MYNRPAVVQPLLLINPIAIEYPAPLIPTQPQVIQTAPPPVVITTKNTVPPKKIVIPKKKAPPKNYVAIPTQPPVVSPPKPKYTQKIIELNSTQSFSELYDDLSEVRTAILSKYFQGGFIRIGEKQKYKVSIVFKDGSMRNIFICQRGTDIFHNDTYNFEIRMKYIPRDCTDAILETKEFDKRLIDLISNAEYGFKPKIYVNIVENNINAGTIQQPRVCNCCCKDANYQIYSRNNQINLPKYSITTRGTQCSYCCCANCCCAEGETSFQIFSNATRVFSGNILKRSFSAGRKDYLNYDIAFPDDASPEEKLLVICAAIGIDNVVYREVGTNI